MSSGQPPPILHGRISFALSRQARKSGLSCGCTEGHELHALGDADDKQIAAGRGALLDKDFFAHDLPKFTQNAKTASAWKLEAV